MKHFVVLTLLTLMMVSCAHKKTQDLDFDDAPVAKKTSSAKKIDKPGAKPEASPAELSRNSGIVVDPQDLAVLDRMTKAVELYVHKGSKKEFTALCKDKRFDCYVADKFFPAKKKKTARAIPPYASGSKMGLQGEERVQVRYEFYP
ncbi:hypothetical protein EZJ49_02260 [Bdellovibrio bacteriovorus]|uniref:hypothetical protein n=1 Tax=Bdellovibrio bacteriovorus TaxID=959 RepID=UPI0021D04E47|nr:hypothetical protein [Bdellovibrio bacteriovorus]UXR65070.1 hypothetical protein EZJ49_02260 [Bdellovibrio bacteriovorus]